MEAIDRPPNDACTTAAVVPSLHSHTVAASNEWAFPSGISEGPSCQIEGDARTLWYRYTSPQDRVVRATLSDHEDFDARLAVFDGGECGSLSCVSSTDARWWSSQDRITFAHNGARGSTSTLAVSGVEGFDDAGQFRLDIEALERPENDACGNATAIKTLPFSIFDSNEGAFPASLPPNKCNITGSGVWYRYKPAKSSIIRAMVRNPTFYAYVSVYEARSCDDIQCLGYNGEHQFVPSDLHIVFPAYAGRSYYLAVHGHNDVTDNAGRFNLTMEAFERPVNDRCASAVAMPSAGGRASGATFAALPDLAEAETCGIKGPSRALWYSFTPTETRTYKVSVSNYDWMAALSLFSGSCGFLNCLGHKGVCLAPTPDPPYYASYCPIELSWNAQAGTTYFFAVSYYSVVSRSFELDLLDLLSDQLNGLNISSYADGHYSDVTDGRFELGVQYKRRLRGADNN